MSSNVHSISRVCVGINEFKDYFLNNNYDDNMFSIDGNLNKNYNNFKKTGTIAQILKITGITFLLMKNKKF